MDPNELHLESKNQPMPNKIKKPIERSTSNKDAVKPDPKEVAAAQSSQPEGLNFSIGFNAGKQTLFSRMSPTKASMQGGNALAATQPSSTMLGGIARSNSTNGKPEQTVPATSSTREGPPMTRQSGAGTSASPFREALKRGVVSGTGMLTF